MKTYAISLVKCKERYHYISQHLQSLHIDFQIIEAIDGSILTDEEIAQKFDISAVKRNPIWFTKGMMACSLSHISMYHAFLESNAPFAFFIEDDVILPLNIALILNNIERVITEKNLVLLHYVQLHNRPQLQITLYNKQTITENSNICFLMNTIPASGAAYIMGRQACKTLLDHIYPIQQAADSWEFFLQLRCFDSIKVLYPRLIETKHFKSSIDYLKKGSFKEKLSNILNSFILSKMILQYWRNVQSKRNSQFIIVQEKSPYDT
ncbi:MAG: glycosyltransferase family 25 protein [Bacteroidales bacterium]|jgi:glycosyl transferase family 25|nr:glycosyltransferase family 25 protein [Bacteroidales bacterium]